MVSNSEQETYSFAKKLAESLPTPAHVLLYGELGAGKTVFAKGLADGFGVNEADEVTSPTFTLINQYSGRLRIYHIDLYRIETGALDGLGLEEIFDDPNAAVIVEWAERLGSFETQPLRPLYDDRRIRIIKNLFKPETVQRSGFDSIQIDVVNPYASGVLVDQCERRARDLVRFVDAKTIGESFGKHRFACTQLSIQEHVRRSRKRFRKFFCEAIGLLLGVRNHPLNCPMPAGGSEGGQWQPCSLLPFPQRRDRRQDHGGKRRGRCAPEK